MPTNTQFWALWIDPKPGAQGEKGEPGEKGENGGEVQSVVKVSTVENVDTYRMTFSNGYTADFTVTNGKDGQNGQNGQNGENGKGIETISLVSSTESSSTYRISYGDGLTFDFTVQNGVSPTITIGNVTTVDSTKNARVENSGSDKNVVLDFYLPKGEKGDPGVSVNAEVVSVQTADDTQKVYSVGFINGILGNFTGQINSIYSDLAKKFGFDTNSILFTIQGLYLQTTISSKGIYSFSINGRMYLINTDLLTGTESVKVIDDLSIYSSETENAFIRTVVTINPSTGLIRVACWKILDIADSATFTQLLPTNELFPKPVLNIIMLI